MANPQIEYIFPGGARVCATEEDTRRVAHDIAACLSRGAILSLEGPMGAGKTCFVKGLAAALGCDPREVSSPTFTLIHEYHGGRLPLVHMDLYRIEAQTELAPLGFDDYLASDGIVAIEWGDKFEEELPAHTLRLVFSVESEGRRLQIRS
jgi:tRNA threonylcarbamoyladenosine biosynthesis protein TsaE